MIEHKKVILKPNKEAPLLRQHPWVFSGAVARTEGKPQDGDVVEVFDTKKNYLATGHYHQGNITVRIFDYQQSLIDALFWQKKIKNALAVRASVWTENTNCFRLVHGEGDGLSGLIVDFYNGVAVLQAHSIGMHRQRFELATALKTVLGEKLFAIYDKSTETLPEQYAKNIRNEYLFGTAMLPHKVQENGCNFLINWETGQKTGFFLDQRNNRKLLHEYASGKSVLNTFCYSGGFSVYALEARASLVHSVDSSEKAIALVEENMAQNSVFAGKHQAFVEDVNKFMKASEEQYDVVILDPPAYAKSMDARHRAVQGYKRLNVAGFKKVKSGGVLFSFSCSQVVDRELFQHTIVAAAIEAKRNVRILHHLSQPPDHPVNLFHPEGSYLKGLVLYVE